MTLPEVLTASRPPRLDPAVASGGHRRRFSGAREPQQPLGLTWPLRFSFPGASLLVQGIAFAPSSATGNPLLTATEGCVLVFQ